MSEQLVVVKVGGSLIMPDSIDHVYVQRLHSLFQDLCKKNMRFIIIVGGGRIAREYQNASAEYNADLEQQDWIGIRATHLNAEFVKTAFGDIANKSILTDPTANIEWDQPVMIAGGWKPGNSTDMIAAQLAARFEARDVIMATNVDHVYPKDPKKFPGAEPLRELTWGAYLNLIPEKWTPGLSAPIDPVAARFAQQQHQTFKMLDGSNIENLRKAMTGQSFIGTTIA